jgi:para-nitrobenzyl esterase
MKKLLGAIIIIYAGPTFALDSGPVVTVASGRLQGVSLDSGGVVFRGIPYAQPPIGDLRWREPAPVLPWSGIRDASKFAYPMRRRSAKRIASISMCGYRSGRVHRQSQ